MESKKQSALSHTRLISAFPTHQSRPKGSIIYNPNLDAKKQKSKTALGGLKPPRRHSMAANLIASSTGGHSFLKFHVLKRDT